MTEISRTSGDHPYSSRNKLATSEHLCENAYSELNILNNSPLHEYPVAGYKSDLAGKYS